MNESAHLKAEMRRQLRAAVASLTAAGRPAAAASVVQRISAEDRWHRARTVMLFIPLADEVDIFPLVDQALDHKKAVVIPRFNVETGSYEGAQITNLAMDLVRGPYGVPEPAGHCPLRPLNQLDVTLVPGLGFDRVGRRLGRGKGHYDRLLKDASGEFWGVGHDCQLVPELPVEPHDVVLNCIVTPAHWVEVVSGRC